MILNGQNDSIYLSVCVFFYQLELKWSILKYSHCLSTFFKSDSPYYLALAWIQRVKSANKKVLIKSISKIKTSPDDKILT